MTRDEAAAAALIEARRWLGTPYAHQGSALGAGADCLGLVRGVWRALFGPEPEPLPPYTAAWAEFGREERLIETFSRILVPVDFARPGEVLCWRMRRGGIAKHCGVVTAEGRVIHAYSGAAVCETPEPRGWVAMRAGAFAWVAG